MLYIIGLGLGDEMDVTMRGWYTIRKCDLVFIDHYTSAMKLHLKQLEDFYGKEIILADRKLVETQSEKILEPAKEQDVAFLVIGNPLFATTHSDLMLRAKEFGVEVKVIHNTSIFDAIGETGLSLYNFGKIGSIPFTDGKWEVNTPYDVLKTNGDLHTLLLLDLKLDKEEFMTVNEAIEFLETVEKRRNEKLIYDELPIVACCALGTSDQEIKFGTLKQIKELKLDKFPQCIVIPGKLHFVEEQILNSFKVLK